MKIDRSTAEENLKRKFVNQWGQKRLYDKELAKHLDNIIEDIFEIRMPSEIERNDVAHTQYGKSSLTFNGFIYGTEWYRNRMKGGE